MAQNTGNARNILVGASPLFLSVEDSTTTGYVENLSPASTAKTGEVGRNKFVPAFKNGTAAGAGGTPAAVAGESYTKTLNDVDATIGSATSPATLTTTGNAYRNVGYTNNGLQITYNPSYGSVTVDQLLDSAKLFKETMEVMIATEMAEGTLENVLAVFGQGSGTLTESGKALGLAAGALGEAPVERQLVAVGQAPTTAASSKTERVYYARRVLSVQQSQFSLARNAASTFPVTFRLLPDGNYTNAEYGTIVDRTWL
jgi:hypothetical protein